MGENTAIEWTDSTWTPIRARNLETGKVGHFCVHKSPGCINCYSERMQRRFGNPVRFAAQDGSKVELFLDEKVLMEPLRWRKPRMVFVCSMTDLFLEAVPDPWIDKVFAVMAAAGQHTFQVLTKRSERMQRYIEAPAPSELRERWEGAMRDITPAGHGYVYIPYPPLRNVWPGVSVEDRARKDRIAHLRDTPAFVRFLSLEPLIEDLGKLDLTDISWCITGGESGPNARPAHPDWFRSVRDQCNAAWVPYFHKQNGEWLIGEPTEAPWDENPFGLPLQFADGMEWDVASDGDDIMFGAAALEKGGPTPLWREFYGWRGSLIRRVGKKRAGRLLDGRTWDEMPGELQ